jgi:hypothetical protein
VTTSYLLPIPTAHRTDWGAAFVEELEKRLAALSPRNLDCERSRTVATRGGGLAVHLVHAHEDERVEVHLWEDEARVVYDSAHRQFVLDAGPSPASWIPDAVDFVASLLAGEVEVETVYVRGRIARQDTRVGRRSRPAGREADEGEESAVGGPSRERTERWLAPSYL